MRLGISKTAIDGVLPASGPFGSWAHVETEPMQTPATSHIHTAEQRDVVFRLELAALSHRDDVTLR
jgi:hypothetical protein